MHRPLYPHLARPEMDRGSVSKRRNGAKKLGEFAPRAGFLLRIVDFVIVACGIFVAAPTVFGQAYVGTLLYPLTPPSGFASAYPINPINLLGPSPQSAFAGQIIGFGNNGGGSLQAVFWNTTGAAVDLTPTISGISSSIALGTGGGEQVGAGNFYADASALLWTGTGASAMNLNPTNLNGIRTSVAYATDGTQQVGGGGVDLFVPYMSAHALLWTGTAASAVDLSPAGTTFSEAWGVGGGQQVGFDEVPTETGRTSNAILWTGTAASAVDLNPNGIISSVAYGTNGTQQVGSGYDAGGNSHALMWSGTAASAVDLNPIDLPGITNSVAYGTNRTEQVGYGESSPNSTTDIVALAWTGSAASAVDLQSLLPIDDTWIYSIANTVDSSGNIYGTAFGSNGSFAVEWTPVPEPASGSLLMIFAPGLLLRRRRAPLSLSRNLVLHEAERGLL
jgi:hypothetical protein